MPKMAPIATRRAFSLTSASASAISSWTRNWTFSRTSSTARPRSDTWGGSVDKTLQHSREDERTGERGADQHLGTLGQRLLGAGAGGDRGRPGAGSVRGGRDVRRRLGPDARRRHRRARPGRRLPGPGALALGG